MATQGVACVHNLIAGSITAVGRGTDNNSVKLPSNRFSPYHQPHDTKIAGFMTILHGDDKFYNNIFVQKNIRPEMKALAKFIEDHPNDWDDDNLISGTCEFNDFPTFEEWSKQFNGYCGIYAPDSDRYYNHLPVWIKENVYFNGARPYKKEENAFVYQEPITLNLIRNKNGLYLDTNLWQLLKEKECVPVSTSTIPMAFEPEEKYENPDGSPIIFNKDFYDNLREGTKVFAGPFTENSELSKPLFKESK